MEERCVLLFFECLVNKIYECHKSIEDVCLLGHRFVKIVRRAQIYQTKNYQKDDIDDEIVNYHAIQQNHKHNKLKTYKYMQNTAMKLNLLFRLGQNEISQNFYLINF
ncbi:unnamed protein product [Paramecium octaurelia]|uniref:Uncharacterized protein n=1 Tax=Paramecium octaurelia TaxID=43137 RepID=A0A8S1U1R3_PAROT|nr:unnamed protein product [Paramecium octaurelia]